MPVLLLYADLKYEQYNFNFRPSRFGLIKMFIFICFSSCFYTFGHLKCPKAERIAPVKTPTRRRFNRQKVYITTLYDSTTL
jgi:hypothetical protein